MSERVRKLLGGSWRAALRLLHSWRRLLGPKLEPFIVGLVNPKCKRFLPPDLTTEDFFRRLDERAVEYVVLRWFEKLPKLDREHDLDLLVADHCTEDMLAQLSLWPIGHPVDVYSETGIGDTSYALMGSDPDQPVRTPLFPSELARQVLSRRVRYNDLCYAPNVEDHFCTLAYHAVFMKGKRSGIPCSASPDEDIAPATHDYAATLRALGAKIGIDLAGAVTRERLAEVLMQRGWRPPAVYPATSYPPVACATGGWQRAAGTTSP